MNERIKEITDSIREAREFIKKSELDYYYDDLLGDHLLSACSNLEYLLSTIKSLQAERDRYREALQNVVIEYIESDATNMDMAIYNMNRIALSALREETK